MNPAEQFDGRRMRQQIFEASSARDHRGSGTDPDPHDSGARADTNPHDSG